MEKILTVTNVADILQVKAITVREMFREKRLRGFKVGKSWRTTETMLQEDIDALARGESPAELPMPNAAAPPSSKAESETAVPAPRKPAPKPRESVAPAPAKARVPKAPAAESEDKGDDTQQMLF